MNIILSNSTRGAYHGVVEKLKNNLKDGGEHIILAPDRFTAQVERGIIATLNLQAVSNIQVMSFTRLANKFVGDDIKKCLTPEGSVMLLTKVVEDNMDKLQYYSKVALLEGFAGELYAAITMIRNSGISVSELKENASLMPTALKTKALDLAVIYDGYLEALEGKHSDSTTRLESLAYFLQNEEVVPYHFYCFDFYDFKAPEYDILTSLSNSALSLSIGLTSGFEYPNKRIYPNRVLSKLKKLSSDKINIEIANDDMESEFDAISKYLFSYEFPQQRIKNDKVKLKVAKDRHDEVLSLVTEIIQKVKDGARYKNFEICVSELASYKEELKSAFLRYNIPFFIDQKELLEEQAKARFIMLAIAVIRSNYAKEQVLAFVKNPLFYGLVEGGLESVFDFENYVLKYSISHTFFNEFKKCDKDIKNEQEIPEIVRKQLVSILPNLKGKQNIKCFVVAIKQLLSKISDVWLSYIDELANISAYYRKCAEQVDEKINSVLDEIDTVLDMETDILGFENIFNSMIKTLKIALVPTFLDCVFIGDVDSRYMGAGDIYILGANNAKLPLQNVGGTVLSVKDQEVLSKFGIDISPNERQKVMDGMYAICEIMKKPHGNLIISYPEIGESGSLRPSNIIYELQGMLEENGMPIEIHRIDFEHLDQLIESDAKTVGNMFMTDKARYHEILRNVISNRTLKTNMEVYSTVYGKLGKGDKSRIDNIFYTPDSIDLKGILDFNTTSVSRIEKFYNCPYSYYLSYILDLKKRKDGEFEGTENGNILHYILEKFFEDVKKDNLKDKNLEDLAVFYFNNAIKEKGYEILFEKAENKRRLERLLEEGKTLVKDMFEITSRSNFKPCYLEAKIGGNEIKPVRLNVNGKTINLRGFIDRVDMSGDDFMVIDYKTFKSAELNLKEIYYGTKIQLHIYMRAIQDSLKKNPVGVVILPIFANFLDGEARYRFSGQVADDYDTLKNIDNLIETDSENAIVPYKCNKKGVLNCEQHLNLQKFNMLGDYSVCMAEKAVAKIMDGFIKPTPTDKACEFCSFADVCAYKEMETRKVSSIKMATFEKVCAKLEERKLSSINTDRLESNNEMMVYALEEISQQNKISDFDNSDIDNRELSSKKDEIVLALDDIAQQSESVEIAKVENIKDGANNE